MSDRIDLWWLPLGSGDRVPIVRWNGHLYEAVVARRERRPAMDLFHAALQVESAGRRYVIEVAPAWHRGRAQRGVAAEGPVGARWLGRSKLFRYEVRCWPDGVIPDLNCAVGGARMLSDDSHVTACLLRLVGEVPTSTWGRDEQRLGDMWNSNSVIAWLLVRSGVDVAAVEPPPGGRAPGWAAGLAAARKG